MTPYAEYLLARPKKPALTSAQSRRPVPHRYQVAWDEKGLLNLSKSVSRACDDFFKRRGLGEGSRTSWGFRGI
jgi:hypothetical protein